MKKIIVDCDYGNCTYNYDGYCGRGERLTVNNEDGKCEDREDE